jgi:glutamate carboxypeptidase
MIIKLLLILLSTVGTHLFHRVEASPPKKIEKQISEYIVKQKNEQVSLLKTLVNINSGTANIAGVCRVGEILRPQFNQLGFDTKWVDEPAHMYKAPTLIATHKGSTKNKLLLIGHLDTVFPKDSPFQTFEKHENTATGPGIIDDKGGIVVILYALKALHATHALDDATITVVLTGDEEDSGKPTSISRKPLFHVAQNSNIALDFEWAITSDTAAIARRGVMLWTLHAEGKDAHSSELFRKSASYGAIFEVTRIINTMLDQLSEEKDLSFNPGLILGGTTTNYNKNTSQGTVSGKANIIAKTAMAKGDLRYLTPDQKENAKTKVLNIVEQHLPGTTASIDFQDVIPSMPPTKNNLKLLEKYSQISRDLGYGTIAPLDASARGAADIAHIASIVSSNLAGLGALGTGAHSTHETLILDSLPIQTQRAALLIYRLTLDTR